MYAINDNEPESVRALLARPDLDVRTARRDTHPLLFAIEHGFHEVVRALFDHKVKPILDGVPVENATAVRILVSSKNASKVRLASLPT